MFLLLGPPATKNNQYILSLVVFEKKANDSKHLPPSGKKKLFLYSAADVVSLVKSLSWR
jgi:hypothetical protein